MREPWRLWEWEVQAKEHEEGEEWVQEAARGVHETASEALRTVALALRSSPSTNHHSDSRSQGRRSDCLHRCHYRCHCLHCYHCRGQPSSYPPYPPSHWCHQQDQLDQPSRVSCVPCANG